MSVLGSFLRETLQLGIEINLNFINYFFCLYLMFVLLNNVNKYILATDVIKIKTERTRMIKKLDKNVKVTQTSY